MNKIEESQAILESFGVPVRYRNEAAALSLLALANLSENDPWSKVSQDPKRIHDILEFIRNVYTRDYAENTRESIRKNALNPFEHARLVNRNPDDPGRPTNSGNTCYAISDNAKTVIAKYGTSAFQKSMDDFLGIQPSLQQNHKAERAQHDVVVEIPGGENLKLSPGKHNVLQADVIRDFFPFFIPNALLLYVGDTRKKDLFVAEEKLREVGLPYSAHEKYPDVVFWIEDSNWLVLVEAVTTHGPIDEKRKKELEDLLKNSPCHPIFVTAFRSWKDFKKYLNELAWDTEVWLSDEPEHMIHYNGPKFLAPFSEDEGQ